VTIAGLLGFIAFGLACAAAAVRRRDAFYAVMTFVLVLVAGILVYRQGLGLTRFAGNADELVLFAGALLLAATILVRSGLPASLEDRLTSGPTYPARAFERKLVEARKPFWVAARAGDPSMSEKARWRPALTARPPSPAWEALADHVAQGDEEYAAKASAGADQEWLPWGARNDQIGAEWAELRAPLQEERLKREPIVRRVAALAGAGSTVLLVAAFLSVPMAILSIQPEGRAAVVPAQPPGRRVYLAPIGDVSVAQLQEVTAFYAVRYDLQVGVLPPEQVIPVNPARNQINADGIGTLLALSYPESYDANNLVIGVLGEDVYVPSRPEWRFAFGQWSDRFAVISTYRMTAVTGPFGDLVEQARLRKFVTRYIGFAYFGLSSSPDPHSVLFENILSRDDLDGMGEDY
jgi:hypothetical protein